MKDNNSSETIAFGTVRKVKTFCYWRLYIFFFLEEHFRGYRPNKLSWYNLSDPEHATYVFHGTASKLTLL